MIRLPRKMSEAELAEERRRSEIGPGQPAVYDRNDEFWLELYPDRVAPAAFALAFACAALGGTGLGNGFRTAAWPACTAVVLGAAVAAMLATRPHDLLGIARPGAAPPRTGVLRIVSNGALVMGLPVLLAFLWWGQPARMSAGQVGVVWLAGSAGLLALRPFREFSRVSPLLLVGQACLAGLLVKLVAGPAIDTDGAHVTALQGASWVIALLSAELAVALGPTSGAVCDLAMVPFVHLAGLAAIPVPSAGPLAAHLALASLELVLLVVAMERRWRARRTSNYPRFRMLATPVAVARLEHGLDRPFVAERLDD